MHLGGLLQLLRGSILNDRTDRVDGTSDYLWEDETLIAFMNEAQRRFAVRGLVLRDGTTPECTEVQLIAGVDTYILHKSVLGVISARMEDSGADLRRVGHALLNMYRAPATDTWSDPSHWTGLPPGATLAFSTDEELSYDDGNSLSVVTMRVYPKPSAAMQDKVIKLRVVRKPLTIFTVDDLAEDVADQPSPELPEDHHIEMLDWAAYLALRIVDDDAGAPKRAAEFAQSFESHVQEAKAAAMRKMFAPTQMGFGRGGFTWSNT